MIEQMTESAGNVLGLRVAGHVTKADYDTLAPVVQ
jgi:hypothetical protein